MEDPEKTLESLLTCPVCQDIFTEPRQLPCGHSACMNCLEKMRDHSSDMPFRCPDCRGYFGQIIEVMKSYTLTNIVDDFKERKRRKAEQTKNVYCDYCPEKTTLAMKMCLKCEVSLCKEHMKDHLSLPVFTGHPLVKPLSDLKERKCPQHDDEVLRYYCTSSRRYMCNMCALEGKRKKQAADSPAVLKRQLTEYMDERFAMLQVQMKESNRLVKRLQEDMRHEKEKARSADSLINSTTVVLLCLWFIVLYYAYNYSMDNQSLTEALEKQRNREHHMYSSIAGLLAEHPIKSQATQDYGLLMLDVTTASPFLGVTADLRTAERLKTRLNYPSSKNRFDEDPQILSERCFSSGSHVWEVEAEGHWDIAACYRSIKRTKMDGSTFGKNTLSWSLTHKGEGKLVAYHNKKKTVISSTLKSSRIAVMVDFAKGNITFGAVDSSITRLHEFKATLTEPVCLGLGLYRADLNTRASVVRAE